MVTSSTDINVSSTRLSPTSAQNLLVYSAIFTNYSKKVEIKFICFSILFGSIIYSGFGIYQTLETIQSNYLQTLSTYQNEN